MSILSTNQKLVRVGQEYSAGENIGIYEHTISSRNWSPDITYAAESAFQRATGYTEAQISALSGEVSDEVSQLGSDIQYISGVALTSHQSLEGYLTKASGDEYYQPIGSYATVSQLESTSGEIVNLIPTDYVNTETLEQTSGNIVNLIPDTSEFITNVSAEQTYQPIGNYLSSNALEGYATQDWVSEQGYLTSVSIPESATWQDVSTTVQTNSAQWAEGGTGDEEVNSFVYNNSATILDVDTTYQQNSATYLTAHQDISNKLDTTAFSTVSGEFLTAAPADMATTGDVAELAQTISETYQVKGDYAERDFVLSSIESATSSKLDVSIFASVSSDFLTTSFGISESAHWEEATNAYEQNSGTYLTAHQSLDGYATETLVEETSGAITSLIPTNYYPDTNPSGFISGVDLTPYATTAEVDSISSMLSGAIDYVSANAGDEFPISADEAIQYVQTNSANIDDTVTSYQTNSGTYLTAHQAISAEEWNDCYDNVNTNSGAWGGSALPISAGPGIRFEMVNGTLVAYKDETLLWSGNGTSITAFTVSEPLTNFKEVVFNVAAGTGPGAGVQKVIIPMVGNNTSALYLVFDTTWNGFTGINFTYKFNNTGMSAFSLSTGAWFGFNNNGPTTGNFTDLYGYEIYGINRIAGGN